ncbi:MAG: glycosidase [Syntrophaceae bacterium]|nr:glycosidase [Syntrophaceae bacterium]
MSDLVVNRQSLKLTPDCRRVIARPLVVSNHQRFRNIIDRVQSLSGDETRQQLRHVLDGFSIRHHDIKDTLLKHYLAVEEYIETPGTMSTEQRLLTGAYFTMEYALESAALFNPSIVPDPDQTDLQPGELRVIMSLRAVGEGHISSIEFRRGVIASDGTFTIEPASRLVATPEIIKDRHYDKNRFGMKLLEMCLPYDPIPLDMEKVILSGEIVSNVIGCLNDSFTYEELRQAITEVSHQSACQPGQYDPLSEMADKMIWLANSNYEVQFHPDTPLSARAIFPVSENESKGIEDARFVHFTDEDGRAVYYATYTAYDGSRILTQLLETEDFLRFRISTLNGRNTHSKGMALFPRRIDGNYAMISRVDGENLFLMYSSDINFWHEIIPLRKPKYAWEYIQIGNCGSPLETEEGWLLLTHGVGPMREYCIGAILLDHDDPSEIVGELVEPLLAPDREEREGYVPNVLYTCGALIHGDYLFIPYAMSDVAVSLVTISVPDILSGLRG